VSPDLELLLAALYERDNCEPADRPNRDAILEDLLSAVLAKQPGLTRDQLIQALHPRYIEFRKARRKPSTLPPKA
jgi:hypothetical protein